MNRFNFKNPTEIIFGADSVTEIGDIVKKYGNNCLLVTVPEIEVFKSLFDRVKNLLKEAGINVLHYSGVMPNPTTDIVTEGARIAIENNVDVVIGLGGGSSMDTAKAIAVEAVHEGSAWDYLFYKNEPTEKTLPIICIATTAGTGSQTTPCSVITNSTDHDKSAIWHNNIFPRAAVVDPLLTVSMPPLLTAATGFDAFTHNFEAYISVNSNPYVEILALNALKTIIAALPKAVGDGHDIEARTSMSWADTLGGIAFASAGVTLPHGIAMQIGGFCPNISHGQALASIYAACSEFTQSSSVVKFAGIARLFDKTLETVSDKKAAEEFPRRIESFLTEIGLSSDLKRLGATEGDLRKIADKGHVLPDYKNNPAIATIEDIYNILKKSFNRGS